MSTCPVPKITCQGDMTIGIFFTKLVFSHVRSHQQHIDFAF